MKAFSTDMSAARISPPRVGSALVLGAIMYGVKRRRPSVILELHTADRLVRTQVVEEMLRLGLEPSLFAILSLIGLHQPVTPTDLALESGVRPTTMRDMVNEMVDAGHVRRTPNPDDQRSHFLELTPDGEQFQREASRAVRNVERALERRLGMPLEELRPPLRQLRHAARAALRDR